jgi:hypothetical protein
MVQSSPQFRNLYIPDLATGKFAPGATEFLQFMEVTIQRWLYQTSRQLSDQNLIDVNSFRYCQQLLCQPRENVNQTMRQLFYHFYNGTGYLRKLNQTRWDGDIKKIMDQVVGLIRRTFYAEEERSDFLDLLPHLQMVNAVGPRSHRWTWELEQHPQYLTLLFSLVMIRLPTQNLAENNAMAPMQFDFPIITEENLVSERLTIDITSANMNHLFYFIPEQNRVFGVWPQSIRVKNDAQAPSQRMVLNYKANLMRSVVVRVKIPTRLSDDGGQIAFDYLFFNPTRNLYRTLRERNPFNFSAANNPITRLYVSLTIYANQNETILHIPYILEGSLSNGVAFDVEEFFTDILDAGLRLASLLTVEYPRADLVGEALSAVTEVVEVFSLEGKWVTSWASSAKSEILATSGQRAVSSSVTFSDKTCKSRVVHWNFLCRLLCRL